MIWLLLSSSFNTASAVFAKQAGLVSADRALWFVVANPWYIASLGVLVLQAACWIMVLRKYPLNLAFPCMSAVLVLNMICSVLIFQEAIRPTHALGTALIVLGIILIVRESESPSETEAR